ncbi:hypothetical protein KAF25_004818 [Fusarium avenaceum]|uniref:Fungal N-terminal domain-containing protein n=1 Tax=Fusarium avenaceum TaxID=40199 RepID=A0A9P7KV80_9HYPO|nr:hypothetical protein KAF25_004818 [Fusarium avenaceum]
MEVLGAVASSIAVIQALAAGKHVVSLIREMPDIQKDFEYMMKELGLIRSMVQAVRSMSPTDFEQDLIDNACGNLEEITKQLETLLRKCAYKTEQGDKKVWKTKKRRWLLDRSDIQKLQQRMGQAKETLHFAVTSSQTSLNSQLYTEVRQMHTKLYLMNMQICPTTEGLQAGQPSGQPFNSPVLCDPQIPVRQNESVRLRAVVPFAQTAQTASSESGLPSRVAARASYLLLHINLDAHQTYLIQRVLSYARDDSEGVTTKVHAAIKQRAGLDEALREQPWAINTVDESGLSSLQLAILEGQVPDMEVLISAGANVEQQMYDGMSALRLAARLGNPEAVMVLLKAKCSVNLADLERETALYSALAGGNAEVIRLLLMAGASATHRTARDITPLHRLSKYMKADFDVIKSTIGMLAMAGADLEANDVIGNTPIAYAIIWNNVGAAKCLVEAGSSLSFYSSHSQNLLHYASAFASLDMLECLCGLEPSDINPYQKDHWGFTPWYLFIYLHFADEWNLQGRWNLEGRHEPTPDEQMAYVELFQGVRDRYLQHDICILEHILSAMRKKDVTAAQEDLALLIGRETNWGCHDRAAWYRAVDKRVQSMEWDFAMEDVEDFLVDMKEELDTPVWKFPSFWGAYLWEEDDEDCITEEESSESDWSSEEDLIEDEVPATQGQDG